MMLYQKLIQDEVAGPEADRNPGNAQSHAPNKTSGYAVLARAMGVPSTSVHEWATYSHNRIPSHKSLVKIAEYFKVPVPTLLMETDTPLAAIVDALYRADQEQLESVCKILGLPPCP